MHNSYQPTLPAANRLLQKRWDDKYYSEHRLLVRDARPTVDTRPPRTFMHLHMNLKKLQLEEERSAVVERDNRILLEKMSTIMRTTGSVNNRNDYPAKSLNREKRRRELLRVTRENTDMLKRIMRQKSDMNRDTWLHSWMKNMKYMDNIAKYDADGCDTKSLRSRARSGEPSTRRSTSAPRDFPGGLRHAASMNNNRQSNVDETNESNQTDNN